ncbi:MAG: hypothetical protein HQ582_13775, partial [Planctomycetes bacterium]|nr:hypothetical protein [Planctomycetota bacterium]
MRLQESPRNRARVQSTLAIILVVVACGFCAYASEGVQWAFSNSDGPDNRPLHAIPASLPPAQEATVMPVAFAEATSSEKRGTLVLKFQDPEGVVPEGTLSELNGDHFQKGFILEVSSFQEDDKKGKLQVKIGSATKDFDLDKEVNAFRYKTNLEEIIDQGEQTLSAVWAPPAGDPEANKRFEAQPLKVKIDTHGPVLDTVQLTGSLDEEPELVIKFGDDDLEESTVNEHNFVVQRFEEGDRFAPRETIQSVAVDETDKSVVRITFGNLQPGVYRLRVTGTGPANGSNGTPLQDTVGNHAGGRGTKGRDQERIFGADPPPEPSKHVEFPEFQPTAPQPHHPRRINPADKVETTVVRLYYFRDAHRVAQILNRTSKSHRHAAVMLAQRNAERARTDADTLTDDRRANEREAIKLVGDLRRLETQLGQAREAKSLQDRRKEIEHLLPEPPQSKNGTGNGTEGEEPEAPSTEQQGFVPFDSPNGNSVAGRRAIRLPSIRPISRLLGPEPPPAGPP